jgi:hypothetical protein
MKKIAALATALLILVPASAMFPYFAKSAAPPGTTLFSRSYSNYTIDPSVPFETIGPGDFKFVIADYSVKYPSGMVGLFDRIGFSSFDSAGALADADTRSTYSSDDVDITLHRIPTAAMEISFSSPNGIFFDLGAGMSALAAGDDGVVVGNGQASSTIYLAGQGTISVVPGGVLGNVSAGSRMLFRANPGQDSFVATSVAQGKVAGEIFTTYTESQLVDGAIAFDQVSMRTIQATNDTYSAGLSGTVLSGKVFIINVDRGVLPKLDAGKMVVQVDGSSAKASESLASILYETGPSARHFIAADGDWLQVYVYVPSVSGEASITLKPVEGGIGLDEIASAMAAVVLVCVAAVALYKRE